MRVFSYFLRHYSIHLVGSFTAITLTLGGVIWLIRTLTFMNKVIQNDVDINIFFYFSFLLLPSLLLLIIPVSLFCAIIYVYNRFITDSELVIWRSVGVNDYLLAKPALLLAFCVTLMSYGLSFYGLPASYKTYKDLQYFIREEYISFALQEGVFNEPIKNMTIYVDARGEGGVLHGIIVHDVRNRQQPITMMAEKGEFAHTPEGLAFILYRGSRQELHGKQKQLSVLNFERYPVDLTLYTKTPGKRIREPEELYMNELFTTSFPNDTAYDDKKRAEGHKRIILPLYNILLACIALTGMISGSFNRRGHVKTIALTSFYAIIASVIGFAIQHSLTKHTFLAFFLYIYLGIVSAVCMWVLFREKRT